MWLKIRLVVGPQVLRTSDSYDFDDIQHGGSYNSSKFKVANNYANSFFEKDF